VLLFLQEFTRTARDNPSTIVRVRYLIFDRMFFKFL
jgi:hypothetical protein